MNSLFPETELDRKVDALKCDPAKRAFILRRLRMAEQAVNCNFRALGFEKKHDYLKIIAAQNHCSVRTVQRCAEVVRRGDDLEGLLLDRPGPKRGGFPSLDADARTHFLRCFLSGLTCRQTYESGKAYLQRKQNSDGCLVSHFYDLPSERTVKRYWREVLIPMYGPQREGREAVKTAAGYIDRLYDDEFAGDTWCLDEWEIDGVFYDEEDHRRIFNYGAGRPIVHILTILDERTTHIIDYLVTWQVSLEDAVFALAERTIRQHFLPRRVVSDRAGRFRALVRGHMVVGSDDALIKKLAGPLGELGVIPRGSEEKNPRANRLERMHGRGLYADRARDFGPSWKPPLEKHEHREIDDAVDRHLNAHCRYGTIGPQLMSIQEAERRIAQWVREINLADTEAKGCNGLTRLAAFRQFQPPADEIAQRKPNQAALDLAFAEQAERAIREGGVIELEDGARYSCPQLIEWRLRLGSGVKIPVMRYRRDPLHLIVSPPGAEPFTAERRAIVGTKDEALLSDEIEKLAHVRKVLGGETAERDREMEERLRALQNNMRGLRARPMTIERAPTSADLAKQVLGLKG
jgi:hypothetical protein